MLFRSHLTHPMVRRALLLGHGCEQTHNDAMRLYLEERGVGFPTTVGPVPIVVGAVLFDLSIGRADVRPDAAAGYAACQAAKGGRIAEGSTGAGAGATVGKALGPERAIKGGIGWAGEATPEGVVVGAK